ncbi:hypothetical protein BT69DRAFT_1285435, partial [Atractiella rhizophila]
MATRSQIGQSSNQAAELMETAQRHEVSWASLMKSMKRHKSLERFGLLVLEEPGGNCSWLSPVLKLL